MKFKLDRIGPTLGLVGTFLIGLLMSNSAVAKLTPEELAKLDKELTPVGAERAGNSEGTIPAWDGATPSMSAFKVGDHHPDPFTDDQPRAQVTKANATEYQDKLSAGHKVMLDNYPNFTMNIFPTRRSATYPDRIYEAIKKNGERAELIDDGEGLVNAMGGSPFPIPKNAHEVIWNHKMRYRGEAVQTYDGSTVVNTKGKFSLLKVRALVKFMFSDPEREQDINNNTAIQVVGTTVAPPRAAGNKVLVHESINSVKEPRKSWIYLSGQRRTRRAPDISYDAPAPGGDGIIIVDNTDMFNGAMDRFSWKLIGKKEMLIPYNSYALHEKGLKYKKILHKNHLNPELVRYELHRVWVVEAELKPDFRHRYSKRVFYIDEDSWQIAMIDQYDNKGNLLSLAEGHPINYYENPLFWYTMQLIYNLEKGSYYVTGLDNQEKMYDFTIRPKSSTFKSSNLARMR